MTRKTKFICGYCNEEKDQEDMANQDFCEDCMDDVMQEQQLESFFYER